MKAVLRLLVGLVFLFLIAGCSVYQQVSVAGDAPQNDHSEFIVENDTISIIYSFHGRGGDISIDLFNKLNKPLYVDWRKSALIIEDESFSLWKDEASLNGVSSTIQVTDDEGVSYSDGFMGGSLIKNETISFIPPYSRIVANNYNLNAPIFNLPKEQGKKITFYTSDGDEIKGRKFSFTPEDSPYIFRIFLSISTEDSFKNPVHFDHSFWVSDYVQSSADPKKFDIYFGNQFFNEQTNTTGNAIFYGALIGAIVLGGAAAETPVNQ